MSGTGKAEQEDLHALARGYLRGDPLSGSMFIRRIEPEVLPLFRRILNHEDNSLDALQDFYIEKLKRLVQYWYWDGRPLLPYLKRSVVNFALDRSTLLVAAASKLEAPAALDTVSDPGVSPEASFQQGEKQRDSQELIADILEFLRKDGSPRNLKILERFLDECEARQIANDLGMSQPTLHVAWYRLRQRIREGLPAQIERSRNSRDY